MGARRARGFLLFAGDPVCGPGRARAVRPGAGERGRQREREVVRLVGQNGRATVEALAGSRVTAPAWERAGEIGQEEYMALVARLLDATVWLEQWPRQELDPNDPGPRRAVALRLVIG